MSCLYEFIVPNNDGGEMSGTVTRPFDVYIAGLWDKAMTDGGVFRYSLDGVTTRSLSEGLYGFVVQNNPKRLTHKRVPVENRKLTEPFTHEQFNFNKITNEREILCTIRRRGEKVTDDHLAIVNVSPIEKYHFLLVPNPKDCLPQVITEDSLLLCLQLLSLSQKNDTCIVANSLLAYASVNHLHYHFINISHHLLAHKLDGKLLFGGVHKLIGHPMKGFGFQCKDDKMNKELIKTASDVFNVITLLLSKSIPHNLFILKRSSFIERDEEEKRRSNDLITVILMPRKPSYGVKTFYEDKVDLPPFFVAACEIGGFVPIIDQGKYPIIKEEDIVSEMKRKSLAEEEYQEIIRSILIKTINQ